MVNQISSTITEWLISHFYHFFFSLVTIFALGSAILVTQFDRFPKLLTESLPNRPFAGEPRLFIFLLGILFSAYAALLVGWESFLAGDDFMFFPSLTHSPQWIYPPIWPTFGRFFPLGHQEFYPLSLINDSVIFYQLFAAIELAVLTILVVRILHGSLIISVVICFAIFLTPGIVKIFMSRIDPERNMLLLLAIIVLSTMHYRESGSVFSFIVASVAGLIILFYKETAFILVGGWSLMWIFLTRISVVELPCKARLTLLGVPLLVASLAWVLLYIVAIYPQIQTSYATNMQAPIGEVLESLRQVWLITFILALILRTSILRSATLDPLWDGLILPISGYVCAYTVLQFSAAYYTAPAAFLAWLYTGHIAQMYYLRTPRYRVITMVSLGIFCAAMLQIPTSFAIFANRKEFISARANTAEFISHFIASRKALVGSDGNITIHFLQDPYRWVHYDAAMFAGYLEAKYGLSNIKVAMPADSLGTRSERCVFWMNVGCHYGLPIDSGDLVVAFGNQAEKLPKQSYRFLYVSDQIGFWQNSFRGYVFLKE